MSKRNAAIALWVSLVLCLSSWSLLSVQAQDIETISARNFLSIQAAIVELERYKLNILDYRIRVEESESSIFVTFLNLGQRLPGQRGNPGPKLELTVELSREGLKVIRSSFIR